MPAVLSQQVAQFRDAARRPTRGSTHRLRKQGITAYLRGGSLRAMATTPIIYSLLLPLALLDLWVSVYQLLCFPAYRMTLVRRARFITVDRHRLEYLNGIEKLNCTFCSYANGVLAYAREVAARTEQYWCPIKHARPIPAPHDRYAGFFAYGDDRGYHESLEAQRRALGPARPRRRVKGGIRAHDRGR